MRWMVWWLVSLSACGDFSWGGQSGAEETSERLVEEQVPVDEVAPGALVSPQEVIDSLVGVWSFSSGTLVLEDRDAAGLLVVPGGVSLYQIPVFVRLDGVVEAQGTANLFASSTERGELRVRLDNAEMDGDPLDLNRTTLSALLDDASGWITLTIGEDAVISEVLE